MVNGEIMTSDGMGMKNSPLVGMMGVLRGCGWEGR